MAIESRPKIDVAPETKDDAAHTRTSGMEMLSLKSKAAKGEVTGAKLHEAFEAVIELEQDLHDMIKGEVRFDDGSRGLYSTDGSNYRQIPIGVVIPRDEEDVVNTIIACHRYGAPVLPRAGGTSLAGQCTNVAVVIDFSKYMREILELDPENKRAVVQPGCVLDHLRKTAEQHHLTFAPDPATHNHNCLGGMIGNNSCGIHSVMGGKTVDNIIEMKIVTYDGIRMRVGKTSEEELEQIINEGGRRGEIYAAMKNIRDKYADLIRERYPKIPRRVSGYNLDQLLPENGFDVAKALVGTEGTCVTVLEATCRLVYSPPVRSLLILGYPDVFSAADHVMEVLDAGPVALEGIDDRLISDMKKKKLHPEDIELVPPGNGWLMVEFGGESKEEADGKSKRLMETLKKADNPPSMKLFDNPKEEKMVWQIRESGLGATANVPGQPLTWEGWEDSAVPPEKAGDYLRELRKLLDKHGYGCDLYGHFGQGCIHTRIDFDFVNEKGIENYRKFMDEATDLVLSFGGSLSGEHGDGQSRAQFLPRMFGDELVQAFREFKYAWDPEGKMNPGKVVDPYRVDQNLRLGTDYNPPQLNTYFKFPDDRFSFSRAALRCVGVGECRRMEGGVMCPSFMVTQEEKDSTRGRARLLFEMLQGDAIKNGWKDEAVWSSLDLCLACKGCKGDCPVNVDMATYKAEFFSHYYEGKMRPLNMYAFGMIFKWARLAALMPGIANLVTHAPVISSIFKKILMVHPDREIPQFAPETFQSWFAKRRVYNEGKTKVLLWPDTFNNFFFPETAKAAVKVLEGLDFQVIVPKEHLCCGRPLYDYGLLNQALKQLEQILRVMRPYIQSGMPVVALEPSCAAVFRDELIGLFPNDEDANRLSKQTFIFSEFLSKYARKKDLPKLPLKAIVHGHCHHQALWKMEDEESVLKRMDVEPEFLEPQCCGMAGAFGYTEDHYEVSMACGERVLLPAVREAEKSTIIIADGFSCREQIQQTTDRHGLHLAEVMRIAMRDSQVEGDYPEAIFIQPHEAALKKVNARAKALVGGGALLAASALIWALARRLSR